MSRNKQTHTHTHTQPPADLTTVEQTTGDPPPPADDIDRAADSLLEQTPEVQQHAIDQFARESESNGEQSPPGNGAAPPPTNGAEVDAAGVAWNADLHAISADGSHPKTKDGLWKRKRGTAGGAPRPRARSVIGGAPTAAAPAGPTAEQIATDQARAAGIACAHTLMASCQMMFGPEWEPQQTKEKNEVALMEAAYGNYFVAKQWSDFPPGIALTLVTFGYVLPRFTMPQTRGRLSRFKTWTAAKVANWKLKREAKKRGIRPEELRREMGLDRAAA